MSGSETDVEEMGRRLARIGSCLHPSFSPDGERIAFISNLSGTPQVWTVSSHGGWPEMVTALDDPVDTVRWSPTGEWLALSVAPGGGMNAQIYVVRPDGTDLRLLSAGGQDNNFLGVWLPDGTSLLFSSNRASADRADVFLVTVAGDTRQITSSPGLAMVIDVSLDGTRALLSRLEQRSDNNLAVLDLQSGHETLLTPHQPPASFGWGRFAPDGSTVYLLSDAGHDRASLSRVRLDDDGAPGPIEDVVVPEEGEFAGFDVAPDGRSAALRANIDGRNWVMLVRLSDGAVEHAIDLPHEVVFEECFSRDGNLLAFTISGSTAPADIWVFDRAAGELRQVTYSPHPGITLDTLTRPELIRFPAHDGLELTAWLYRPPGETEPGPLVLSFHGGPEAQERPLFNSTYQALLQAGIGVLAPNVRGSTGFGKRFTNLDNGSLRFDAIRDIEACRQAAIDCGAAAPGRIGIMGGSYGGYMTMAGLVHYPEAFAAGANLFGIVNFATFFEHSEQWMAAISKIEYGDPDTQADLLRDLSPIHRIDAVRAPTLVLHGANDTNVPVVEAEQVVESLRARGVPVEYVLFEDEGHGWRKLANRIRSTTTIVQWFSTHLARH